MYLFSTGRMIENPKWKQFSVLFAAAGAALAIQSFFSDDWQEAELTALAAMKNNFDNQSHSPPTQALIAADYALRANAFMSSFFPGGTDGATLISVGAAFNALTSY